MAQFRSDIQVHGNANLGIVDSEQIYGSIKNYISDFRAIHGFNGAHQTFGNPGPGWNLDDFTTYTTDGSILGKYKPWGTFLYIEDTRSLVETLTSSASTITIDVDGTDRYFEVAAGAPTSAQRGFFVYKYDAAQLDGNNNVLGNSVSQFTVTEGENPNEATAVPTFWESLSETVGGSSTGIENFSVTTNTDGDLTNGPVQQVLGAASFANDVLSITFPTNADILDAFQDGPNIEFDASADAGNQHRIKATINAASTLTVGEVVVDNGGAGNGNLTVDGATSVQALTAAGTLTASAAVSITDATQFVFGASTPPAAHGDGDGLAALIRKADGTLVTKTLDASAFSADTGVVNITNTDSNVDITGSGSADVGINLSGTLHLAPNTSGVADWSDTVTIGPNALTDAEYQGATQTLLVVQGNTIIKGDLDVEGTLTTNTVEDITVEDSSITLRFPRETDGTPSVGGSHDSGVARIEAWHGKGTAAEDASLYARPFIQYEYIAGDGYGKWYLANNYTVDYGDDGIPGGDNLNADTVTANKGAILTDIDVAKVATAQRYHEQADGTVLTDADDNNLTQTATPYGLLEPYAVLAASGDYVTDATGQGYTRKFGRVSKNAVTYTQDMVDAGDLKVYHGLNTSEVYVIALAGSQWNGVPQNSAIHTKYKVVDDNSIELKIQGAALGHQATVFVIG